MRNRHMIFKLFCSYIWICVLMLGISYVVTNYTIDNTQKEIDEKIIKNGEDIVQKLDEKYIELKNKAVMIYSIDQLEETNMLDNKYSTVHEGINYISNILRMDDFLEDLALCYNGNVYSSKGYSRLSVWLKGMGCEEDNVSLGIACLEDEEMSTLYLRTSNYHDRMLLKYPMGNLKDGKANSVIFAIRMDEIYELLQPLMEQASVWIQLTFQNQYQMEQIWLKGTFENGIEEIDQTDFDVMLKNNQVIVTDYSKFFGMELSVVYDAREIYQQTLFLKRVNEWSCIFFSLLAIFISYKISSNHYQKIYRLKESIARTWSYKETVEQSRWKDDFDTMQFMIQHIAMETDRMKTERNTVLEEIKQQVSMLLFYGGIREERSFIDMLDQCGIELHEKFYTVSCIVSEEKNGILPLSVESLLQEHLGCISSVDGQKAVIIFFELPNEDFVKKLRSVLAEEIQQAAGEHRVKIAFSQVYENILRASEAYLEATGICEKLLNTKKQFVGYMDEEFCEKSQKIRFDDGALERFEEALMKREPKLVLNSLNILFDDISRKDEPSGKNKKYLRYCIIQRILFCLNRMDEYRDTDLIKEITEINIDQDDFERQIRDSMSRICGQQVGNENVQFSQILEYIRVNYYRYDLSLEDVADYAGLSRSYMSRLFKEKTGSKYIEYLTRYRMEQAQKYLKETDLSINEIAGMVGYYNVPNFRNKFKETYGMSASEYRRQQKALIEDEL